MKRTVGIVFTVALLLVALLSAGCTGDDGGAVKLGLGTVTSIDKSRDQSVDEEENVTTAQGQVDTVIAAATFDAKGRVVDVIIDTAQTRVAFDEELQLASDPAAENKTKKELGDDYNMRGASSIGKEWYEQIAALEDWMKGKTVAEIKALKVKQRDEAHPAVPDDPELSSLVTITVQDYIAAVEKAYQNAVDVKDAVKLGLGQNISIAKSRGYSVDEETNTETLPMAQVDTVIAATAFDAKGKVAGVIIDTAQTRVNFDAEGKVTSDKSAAIRSKKELGDDYNMRGASSIDKEWYEQIAALENWMKGKTVAEIKALKVKQRDEAHPAVPDDPELTSLVTITVQDYIAAVAESFEKSR